MSIKPRATAQASRIHHRRVGAFQVSALNDGYVELSHAVWLGAEPALIDRALAGRGQRVGGMRNGITSHLLNTGTRLVMVDAGAAGLFGPHANAFPGNLAEAGVSAADIDEVLVTHAHPDHVGALLKEGRPTLPNATLRLSETDLAFWTSEEQQGRAPGFMRDWFDLVRAVVAAYGDRVQPFGPGAVLSPGITSLALPGHTPGHTGYLIESEGDSLLIWGDLAVSAALQFPHPEAHMIFDIDPETGRKTRLGGFDRAASDRILTAGTHLPFPTFGWVVRRGHAYEWIQDEWRYDPTEAPLQPVV